MIDHRMEQILVAVLSALAGIVGLISAVFVTYRQISKREIVRVNIRGTEIKISNNANYAEIAKILEELEKVKEEEYKRSDSAVNNAEK